MNINLRALLGHQKPLWQHPINTPFLAHEPESVYEKKILAGSDRLGNNMPWRRKGRHLALLRENSFTVTFPNLGECLDTMTLYAIRPIWDLTRDVYMQVCLSFISTY